MRAKKGTEHMLDIERAMWWGEKDERSSGTTYTRTTGGVLEFLSQGDSYVQNQGGQPLMRPDLMEFCGQSFTYGEPSKYVFAGRSFIQAVNEIGAAQIRLRPNETAYGMKISEWNTIFGTLNIVHNPLFVEDYLGYAFALNLDCFALRPLLNRDTRLEMNIQPPGTDAEYDHYITEMGLERREAPRQALLKGIVA